MSKLDDVIAFRSYSRPLMTQWSVGDIQAFGSFVWSDMRPILTLFWETDEEVLHNSDEPNLSLLEITNPPAQVNITCTVPRFGIITLEHCARYNVRTNHNLRTGRKTYEFDFMPTAIWMGALKETMESNVVSVVASDTRLAGFFGSPGLKSFRNYDLESKDLLKALDDPERVWAIHGPKQLQVQIGDKDWHLSLYTDAVETVSATEGHILRSTVNIEFHSKKTATLSDASNILSSFEEIISTFSIEPFIFQFESYDNGKGNIITLAWRFGEDRELFHSPLRHQILIDLSDPVTLQAVCKQWFVASLIVRKSRWLFVRALRETDDGLARFVSVAQAFEVLGRELGPNTKLPKSKLQQAADLIGNVLKVDFEKEFVERTVGLIKSSNRASFSTVLYHMLSDTVERGKLVEVDNMRLFCKRVADIRNAVVHMTDSDEGKLNEAFSQVNKMSLQLCFWYSVCQAVQMGLTIPNIEGFLFNNRNARHGLPNELLEPH